MGTLTRKYHAIVQELAIGHLSRNGSSCGLRVKGVPIVNVISRPMMSFSETDSHRLSSYALNSLLGKRNPAGESQVQKSQGIWDFFFHAVRLLNVIRSLYRAG
jgi:hypothetical protein